MALSTLAFHLRVNSTWWIELWLFIITPSHSRGNDMVILRKNIRVIWAFCLGVHHRQSNWRWFNSLLMSLEGLATAVIIIGFGKTSVGLTGKGTYTTPTPLSCLNTAANVHVEVWLWKGHEIWIQGLRDEKEEAGRKSPSAACAVQRPKLWPDGKQIWRWAHIHRVRGQRERKGSASKYNYCKAHFQ